MSGGKSNRCPNISIHQHHYPDGGHGLCSAQSSGLQDLFVTQDKDGEECEFDNPESDHLQPSESLVIFDDVFVPWERVFMCGEWQHSQSLVYAFASYHRLFGTCKMTRWN